MADNDKSEAPVEVPPEGAFGTYQFTPESWSEALASSNMPDLAAAVVDILQPSYSTGDASFDYESLRNGTSPWLRKYGPALVAGYRKGQGINNEQILGAFTNARQYTPNYQLGQLGPLFDSAKENLLQAGTGTAGFGAGFKYGYRATPGPWWAKILGGAAAGTGASIPAVEIGKAIDETLFGPKYIYLPKDQSMANAGETLAYGVSGVPLLRMFPKEAGNLAASRLLSAYNRVAEAGAPGTAAASLEAKYLARQLNLPTNLFKRAVRGEKAPGFTRLGSTLEGGVASAGSAIREKPIRTTAAELATAGASAGGAYMATEIAPGEAVPRLLGETVGAIFPALTFRATLAAGEGIAKGTSFGWKYATDSGYRKRLQEAGRSAAERRMGLSPKNAARVYEAFALASQKFPGESPNLADTDQFNLFLKDLGEYLVDENGAPLELKDLGDVGPEEILKQLEKAATRVVLDEDGKPLAQQPSAALRLSMDRKKGARALGALQEAFDNLSSSFEAQGKQASAAWLKGAQAYLEASRFEGSSEALREAAAIAMAVFEADITRQINDEVGKLVTATQKVVGDVDNLTDSQAERLNQNLYTILERIAGKTKAVEKTLWEAVEDLPVTEFFDADGNQLQIPNVLLALDTPLSEGGTKTATATARGALERVLGREFFEDMDNFRAAVTGVAPVTQGPNVKATNAFVTALEKAEGTRGLSAYEKMRDQLGITEEVSEANIDLLADAEERILRGAKYRSPAENKATREASRLFKLARESMIAQKNRVGQPAPAAVTADPITYGKLQELRSAILAKRRELVNGTGQNKGPVIKALGNLEKAILADIQNNPDTSNDAYNLARSFTAGRGTAFAKGVLDDIYASVGQEASRMDAGQLLDFIRGSGNSSDVRNLRLLQRLSEWVASPLEEIGPERGIVQSIIDSTVIPDAATEGKSIIDATTDIYRNIFLKIVDMKEVADPSNPGEVISYPVVNGTKLANFKKSLVAEQLYELIPGLKQQLADSQTAQAGVDSIKDLTKAADVDPVMQAMSSMLGSESPEIAISKALNGPKPVDTMNRLLRTLTNDIFIGDIGKLTGMRIYPDQVREGLRKAILNFASVKAGGIGETMQPGNARRLYSVLFEPVPRADEKFILGSWMLKNDLITPEHLGGIKKNLQEFMAVEDAAAKSTDALQETLTTKPSGAKLFQTKMLGLLAGSATYSKGTEVLEKMGLINRSRLTGSLAAQSAGSEQAQNLLIRIPEMHRLKLQAEYLNDPAMLARMLLVGRTKAQNDSTLKRIGSFITGKGIRFFQQRVPYGIREMQEEDQPPKRYVPPSQQEAPDQRSSVRPPAVPTRTVAAAQQPPIPPRPAPTPAPPSVASAPASPETRQRYAALFPNDPASSMIRSQGIGGLLG